MYSKLQNLLPGEQPNITAGGLATMPVKNATRISILYAQLTVTKAAGGSGVYSLPLLTDIASASDPLVVKIGGNPHITRLASELIAMNKLQDALAGGSVEYFQDGASVAVVNDANNAAVPSALVANKATTAVFQVPFHLAEYWRKNAVVGEALSWPLVWQGGALPVVTIEVPIKANAGGAFSAWSCVFWYDYDNVILPLPSGQSKPFITRKNRSTKLYAATGDVSIAIPQRDLLQQMSFLLASGDTWSKIVIAKNGAILKTLTPAQARQSLLDHGMNTGAVVANRCDVVFDANDDINSSLPLTETDALEITLTLSSVAGSAQMVVLTEYYGAPVANAG